MANISGLTEANILKLIYNATAWANYADNAATSPQTNIAVALHTSDPGTGGNSSSSEVGYTGYARVNVARSTGGWTVTATGPASCSPNSAINFPAGTGGSGTVTFFSTSFSNGSPPTLAQTILWMGTVTPNITTGSGVTPSLSTASTITLL